MNQAIQQLEDILEQPFSPEAWHALVQIIRSQSPGKVREQVLSIFLEGVEDWEATVPKSLLAQEDYTGLWKLVYAREIWGETGYRQEDDVDDEPPELIRYDEDDEHVLHSWFCHDDNNNQFFLEVQADGRYRELDFSRYPLEVKDREGEQSEIRENKKIGLVLKNLVGFKQKRGKNAYYTFSEPERFTQDKEDAVLHLYKGAVVSWDRLIRDHDNTLTRECYLIEGDRYTLYELDYERFGTKE